MSNPEKLAATEANVYLFSTLKLMNLATNDVMNFVKKQSEIKRIKSDPDARVLKAAMKSKMNDAVEHAKRLRRLRDSLKRKVQLKFPSKAKSRRMLADLYSHYCSVKNDEMADARNKIEHLKWKELKNNAIREAPY